MAPWKPIFKESDSKFPPENQFNSYGEYIIDCLERLSELVRPHSSFSSRRIEVFIKENATLINSYGKKIESDGGHETDTSVFDIILNVGLYQFKNKMEEYLEQN
jgi:hypothetical protein